MSFETQAEKQSQENRERLEPGMRYAIAELERYGRECPAMRLSMAAAINRLREAMREL